MAKLPVAGYRLEARVVKRGGLRGMSPLIPEKQSK